MDTRDLTILHVEDDREVADLVQKAFERFGFRGGMLSVLSVAEAVGLLEERARGRKPLALILTDMHLPDGTGLDVIREAKAMPAWSVTPVIVLSGDTDAAVVDEAYALGANCYLPKVPTTSAILSPLHSLYQHWLEHAALPRAGFPDRLQEALERALTLRARTAEFYLTLASRFEDAPDEQAFWLDRALNEGNLSNLLAFFLDKTFSTDVPAGMIDRLSQMQTEVRAALEAAETSLKATARPPLSLAYQWAFGFADAVDEEVFAEVVGVLFPVSSVATTALKARAAGQVRDLASHVLGSTTDDGLRRRAEALLERFQQIGRARQ
jgi:CheY-like chemotaxis protein